jgi:outer membrane protein TolC
MNKNIIHKFMIFILFFIPSLNANQERIISIEEILNLAEQNSYAMSAAQYQELAAKKAIIIAKAGYFPVVNLEAIDSFGFPGSSGWIGVEGLMGSPFRKELSGGLVAKQILYDFGRTSSDVKKSKYEADFAKQNTKVTAYDVKLLALLTYYDCSQYRTLEHIWGDLSKEAAIITKEVVHFVNTGQRSIVDKYLSQIQVEEANTAQAYFAEKVKGTKHELAIITGLNENSFSCQMLSDKSKGLTDPALYSSPFLARAKADLKIAQASLSREKADLMPKIVSVASVGAMEKTHLVGKKDYSIGLGIIVPLYDLHVVGGIKRARAVVSAKNEEVEAQIQFLEEMNAKYDTIINSSRVKMEHLKRELSLAQEGFKVAKRRYFTLEGPIIDVREAFKDLAKASIDTEDANANLLKGQGAKELLNGG